METKQGKIKAIPVKEVIEGMQVIDKFGNVAKLLKQTIASCVVQVKCRDGELRNHDDNYRDLKTLIVEYESDVDDENNWIKHLPLKYSQWQSAIDDGTVDTDKVVEFGIKHDDFKYETNRYGVEVPIESIKIAEIIPQKERNNTNAKILNRDLIAELRALGLTFDQCCQILEWSETLPIHILGLSNIRVTNTQGLIIIQPNVKNENPD